MLAKGIPNGIEPSRLNAITLKPLNWLMAASAQHTTQLTGNIAARWITLKGHQK